MTKMNTLPAIVAALLATSIFMPARAEFFKCRDAGGKVSYSDTGCMNGSVGESIPVQANTVDSYGDRLRMAEQAEAERRPRGGGSIGTSTRGSGTAARASPTGYGYAHASSSAFSSSSSSQCSDRTCRHDAEEGRLRPVPSAHESRSQDSGMQGQIPGNRSTGSGDSGHGHDHDDPPLPPPRQQSSSSESSRRGLFEKTRK